MKELLASHALWRNAPRLKRVLPMLCVFFSSLNGSAQCLNINPYPFGAVAAAAQGNSVTIDIGIWAGDYSEISGITTGTSYTASSSILSDFITVREGTSGGPVLAFGTTPLTFTATSTSNVYIHWNNNPLCGTDNTNRTGILATLLPPPTGCISTTFFGNITAPAPGNSASIVGQWAGEFSTINSAVSGNTYTFSSSVGTDFITITDASNVVLASGVSPVLYTSTVTGTLRVHVHTSSSCGTANTDRTVTVSTALQGCTTGAFYSSQPAPAPGNTTTYVGIWGGEYGVVTSPAAGQTYTFSSTVGTDFLTIADDATNTILISGTGSVNYTTASTATIRVYVHPSSACGTQNTGRTLSVFAVPSGCTTGNFYNNLVAPLPGNITSLSGMWAGEYLVLTGLIAGTPYDISTTVATDYLTLTTTSNTLISAGSSPFIYTPLVSGDIRVYVHTNSSCGTENVDRGVNVSALLLGCTDGVFFNSTALPVPGGTASVAGIWAGEYAQLTGGVLAQSYTVSSSILSDFITIADDLTNAIVATGTGSVTFVAPAGGAYRAYVNTSSACGASTVNRTLTITSPLLTCIAPTVFQSQAAAAPGGSVSFVGIWAGEYGEVTSVTAGYTYTFSSSNASDFLTITNGANAPLASGTGSVIYTAAASGTLRVHVHTNAACGTANVSRTVTVATSPIGCNTGNFFTTVTGPTPGNTAQVFGQWAGEYSLMTGVVAGQQYQISSSFGSDFITITSDLGVVLDAGTTPVTYVAASSGDLRIYVHTSSLCGTENINRTISIFSPPTGCVSAILFSVINAPAQGFSETILGQWAGEYSTVNNAVAGNAYTFTSTTATDFITITDASDNVLTAGVSPLVWTSTLSGTLRVHVFANALCGTENVNRNITVSNAPPGCTSGGLFTFVTAPPTGLTEDIFGQWAGEYSVMTGVASGQEYEFSSSIGTDYITITDNATNSVLAAGTSPVTYTATSTADLRIYVHTNSSCGTQNSSRIVSIFAVGVFVAPVNDNCSGAIPVTCGSNVSGNTVGANNDLMPQQCGAATPEGVQSSPGIWYVYTGNDQTVQASLCGSLFDTRISVYEGSCGELTCVAGNDDFCFTQSQVTFNAFAGSTYYILVHGFGSAEGAFGLSITCSTLCFSENDNCATAQPLTINTNGTGPLYEMYNECSTTSAVPNPGFACGGSFSALTDEWFSFNNGLRDSIHVSVAPTEPAPISGTYFAALYSGACGSLSLINCVSFDPSASGEFWFIGLPGDSNYSLRIFRSSSFSATGGYYTIGISGEALCGGIPVPGPTTTSAAVVCPGQPFTLGITNDLPAGINYIWQSGPTLVGPWTNLSTGPSEAFTVTSQSVNTWYRVRANCVGSGQTGVASPVQVTMASLCYPLPTSPTSPADTDITSVSVGTGTNATGCSTGTGPGSIEGIYASYLNQPSLTSLVRGGSAPFSIVSGQCPLFSNYFSNMAFYIDFDQSGTFEASEEVFDAGTFELSPFTFAGTINIPSTAQLGQTGMRVILSENNEDITPDAVFIWGEVEDYVVTIVNPAVPNDFQSFATNVVTGAFPTCSTSFTADLAQATDSPETAGAGNDAWYTFTAVTNAVRIQVTGATDNRIELYDGTSVIASENDVAANGNETLVFDGLTPGNQYFAAVIANGTASAATICISHLRQSGCSAPSAGFPATFTSPCQQFKSIFTSASSYTAYFDVNATAPFDGVSVSTPGTTYHPITSFAGLPPLTGPVTYQVAVDATYNLFDAAGNPVSAVVPGTFNCTRSVVAHANIFLRNIDASPNVKPANALIGANSWLCGALNYQWTIQQFDAIGGNPLAPLPTVVNGPPVNRFLNLTGLGLVPNGIYKVNITPVFPTGIGNTGPDRWLLIAGPAPMILDENQAQAFEKNGTEATIESALYPNPSNGSFVNLNITGVEANVMVRVLDGMGRVVWINNLVVEGSLNTIIAFERPLASGLYTVEMTYDGKVITERLMVQK